MTMTRDERIAALKQALKERILVLDGAMGTSLQACDLSAGDFGGEALEGCNENLVRTRPDVITRVHNDYIAAGADIIETDTFGSMSLVMAEYDLENEAEAITKEAARLARAAADAADRPVWVAGSMGPTTKAISVTGGVTFDALIETFRGQARGLIRGGADYLLIETCQDTRNIKAALLGCQAAFDDVGEELPLAVSGTIEPMGTMLAGQGVEALTTSLEHVDLLYLGLNCATGPAFMADHIRALSGRAGTRIACVPNAGLPDEDGNYGETPEMIAAALGRFMDNGWLNLVGGCCGTTPAHIRALAAAAAGRPTRVVPAAAGTFISGIENLEMDEDNRPVLVGERTNVIGSRRFKNLIKEQKFEEAAEIARRQVKGGAQIIDVCLADPDSDERVDIELFLDRLIRVAKAPLMIDSTDVEVIAAALPWCQGKSVINSINLEDGEDRFQEVVPLGRRYGAAFVVGCIDDDPEQGMAVTRQRKLAVAERSHNLLTEKYGVPETDIIFDPLVFPCGTGDTNYVGSALETVEGVRLIKERFPRCKTILGISNVSFGLPAAGREVLNSVFLYHCTRAGLDAAIVNTEKLERYPSISEGERELAEKLLFAAEPAAAEEALTAFAAHFRGAGPRHTRPVESLPLEERLPRYILEGSKDGLTADLDEALKTSPPLEIINGPLMAGMAEVGRLFNANELIVAEVLQSAEAMKAAVAHLEPLMEKADSGGRGRLLLATVKGDVHDIGKNLVEIILNNNGFRVINLGIKVPPHALIEAIKEHKPDLIGLSGLLVKSTREMVIAAEELKAAGFALPLLVGGAALTRSFTHRRIAPVYDGPVVYAPDAMSGLDLAGRLMDPEKRPALEEELRRDAKLYASSGKAAPRPAAGRRSNATPITPLDDPPAPPDLERHVLPKLDLDDVWSYINPAMLYNKHLGLKGRFDRLLAAGDSKALFVKEAVDTVKAECRQGAMTVSGLYRFFPVEPDGERLVLYSPGGDTVAGTLAFRRQQHGDGRCLTDYVRGPLAGGRRDTICLMVTSAGAGIRDLATRYRDEGAYLKSHALQALALESAEAAMEWLHARVRGWWGSPDPGDMPRSDLFKAKYSGKRYSFGYPACPDLEEQKPLFDLMQPEEIGIHLTEGYMMDPEASVSAIAFHHPEATYFSVGDA
jgi:5-methyltetrahydrofolate--homocysteine methyltransferase